MQTEGVTLLEILTVIIIIGILAAIALPNFAPVREYALDKEASASLKLVQAAEKIYKMENDFYYPYSAAVRVQQTDIPTINTNLKLYLPTGSSQKWSYTCDSGGCSDATRYSGPNNRTWRLRITDSDATANVTCP